MNNWKLIVLGIAVSTILYYFYAYHQEMKYANEFCNQYYTYVPAASDGRGQYHMISVYGQKFESRDDAIESCLNFHKSQFDIRYRHQ